MRTIKNVQIPGSLLGRFKAESKGYRPDILSYNANLYMTTQFSAERSLADTEEGDENEKRFLSSFNSSEAQASTTQRRPLGFSAVVVNAAYTDGDRRKDDSQQFSRPAAESKLSEPRFNVPRAESVKNYC